MGQRLAQLEQTLDRRWRGGHPFRPRLSRKRRVGMLAIFVLLCAVIGAYWYLTDADRVRGMAEAYLSKVLGGRVDVGEANLSIFEGLRLDDVRVHVDQTSDDESLLFRAKTFRVDYNPRALLVGKIEAAKIVAIAPELRLVQDRETGEWNYQRIVRAARERRKPTTRKSPQTIVFPEILLRDGRVDNGELTDGQYRPHGTLGFEGRLSPTGDEGRYSFEIQCHGPSDPVGPAVTGWVVPDTGQVRLRLRDFAFGRDIRGMLPAEVRAWWQQHALAGTIDSTDLFYTPAKGDQPADWRVETSFKGVTLRIRPEEWRTRRQNLAIQRITDAVAFPRALMLGSPNTFGAQVFKFTQSVPVRLEHGEGVLVFDASGLEIRDLRGTIEGSRLQITGRYGGYSPDAPIHLHVQSLPPEHITFDSEPKFIHSLPVEVQENWRRFHPVGSVKLSLDVIRPDASTKPRVTGVIDVIDGYFTCDRFPYTCRKPTGQIILDVDPEHGGGTLELRDLKGYGKVGGPNENKIVTVSGTVDHLGPDPGMHLEIGADDIVSEPAVLAAIPHEAQTAVTLFDAPGKGEFPKFAGGFKCVIDREPGKDKHIFLNIDLDIRNGSGRLKSFPYPLENFSARAEIRDDHVVIPWAKMKRNGTELAVSGQVRWEDFLKTGEKIGTDLKVAVKDMAIDQDLLNALTPVRRAWLQKVGLGGKLDFDGRVYSDKSPDDIVVDLGLGLKGGTIWPGPDGEPAVSDINGKLHLNGDELELKGLTGRRGEGTVALNGVVSWKNDQPKVALKGSATNLAADLTLYKMLPEETHVAWDAVAPEGTFDADVTYTGGVGEQQGDGFAMSIRPRKMAATPKVAPYRLENLTGEVAVTSRKVTIKDVKGTHGKGTFSVSGVGAIGGGPGEWTLKLAGKNLAVDDAFMKGMPEAVAAMLKSVDYKGAIGFDVPKLVYRAATETTETDVPGDIDFGGAILMDGNAALSAGVPMSEVKGKVEVAGAVRDGRLAEVKGGVAVDSMKVAGREAKDVQATILKAPGDLTLHVGGVRGALAGGAVSGDVSVTMPEVGPSRYAVNMVLRNADVKQVAGDDSLNGSFTGSIELEGDPADPKSRIGRGDVLASGKDMYKVPVMMGLLQITNLSLPFTSPFNEAQAQYIIQGSQMTFENIELRGDSIVMRGAGSINFDNKKVALTFNTDSPSHWIKLPIVQDVWQSAKKELFQISIRGTVQEPKVSANPFHTVTTTVDEVLHGGQGK